MTKFITEDDRVFYGHQYICTISAPNSFIDESRLDGESWIDMYDRTKPLRDLRVKQRNELALVVANALNKHYEETKNDY